MSKSRPQHPKPAKRPGHVIVEKPYEGLTQGQLRVIGKSMERLRDELLHLSSCLNAADVQSSSNTPLGGLRLQLSYFSPVLVSALAGVNAELNTVQATGDASTNTDFLDR